jgi:hypothetical protein
MGKILAVAAIVLLVVGGLALYSFIPKGADQTIGTHPIKFSAIDLYAGGQDATTSAVLIYRMQGGLPVSQETVTINAAEVSTTMSYTSMETLKIKLYDATDISVCTQYQDLLVPYDNPSTVYNNYYMVDLKFVDRGDTDIAVSVEEGDGSAMAASSLQDLTTQGWNTAFAEWLFEAKQTVSDKGYTNTYDFLYGHGNYHYFYLDVYDVSGSTSGGWTNFIFPGGGGWLSFERNNHRYFAMKLSDNDVTRDAQTDGSFNPDGSWGKLSTINLKGMTAGMNITIVYGYRYYADWDYFTATGSWGENTAATTETLYIQY